MHYLSCLHSKNIFVATRPNEVCETVLHHPILVLSHVLGRAERWQIDAEGGICGPRLALTRVHNELNLLKFIVNTACASLCCSPHFSNFVDEAAVGVGDDHATITNVSAGDQLAIAENAARSCDTCVGNLYGGTGPSEGRRPGWCQEAAQNQEVDLRKTEHVGCL